MYGDVGNGDVTGGVEGSREGLVFAAFLHSDWMAEHGRSF